MNYFLTYFEDISEEYRTIPFDTIYQIREFISTFNPSNVKIYEIAYEVDIEGNEV